MSQKPHEGQTIFWELFTRLLLLLVMPLLLSIGAWLAWRDWWGEFHRKHEMLISDILWCSLIGGIALAGWLAS